MENKKGFTLVELLAVILILGILGALVSIPIVQSLKKSKSDLQDYQIVAIENAARSWGVENILQLPTESNQSNKCITVRQLVDAGFLDEVPINMETEEPIDENSGVQISCNGTTCKRLNYEYVTSCDGTIVDAGNEVLPKPEIPPTTDPVDTAQCFSYAIKTDDSGVTLSEIMIVEYLYDGGTCGADVEIPERINNIVVTEIGDAAFATNGSVITSVSIPLSVKKVGKSAFQSQKLETVNLPTTASEIVIDDYAFASNNISELTISDSSYGNSVKISIGDYSFYDNELANISFTNAVTDIGNSAFEKNNLVSVTNVTSGYYTKIGNRSFANNNLESFTWPASISEIGMFAFFDNQLTDDGAEGVIRDARSIGYGAFNDNQMVNNAFVYARNRNNGVDTSTLVSYGGAERDARKIVFPDSLTTIGKYSFYNCSLTGNLEFKYNSNINVIDDGAFAHNNLNSVTIGKNLEYMSLGSWSFGNAFSNDSPYYFWVSDEEFVQWLLNNDKEVVSSTELQRSYVVRTEDCSGTGQAISTNDKDWYCSGTGNLYGSTYSEFTNYLCPSSYSICPRY